MRLHRYLVAVSSAALIAGCSESGTTAPTPAAPPARLSLTVTPNPVTAPAADGEVTWTLAMRAGNNGNVLIDRGDATLLDAAGNVVGSLQSFWSHSTGCSACSTDITIPAGGESSWWQHTRSVGATGGRPVRFTFTLQFIDDLGPGTATVEVPVR